MNIEQIDEQRELEQIAQLGEAHIKVIGLMRFILTCHSFLKTQFAGFVTEVIHLAVMFVQQTGFFSFFYVHLHATNNVSGGLCLKFLLCRWKKTCVLPEPL